MGKQRLLRILSLWCWLLYSVGAFAQAPKQDTKHAFSIQQCIEYAKKNNVQVKNALLDLQIQEQTNKSITAGALPTISGVANTQGYFDIPVQLVSADGFGNLFPGSPSVPAGTKYPISLALRYNAAFGLQLSQVLFDGQVFVGLQARKASIDYQQKAIDVTEENIRVNVYKVYYQLIVSRSQMEDIDSNIAKADRLLHDTKIMYDNGFRERLDIDRNNVQLANLQTQKQRTQSQIDNGYLGLKYLMGMPVKDTLVLTDRFTEEDLKTGVLSDTSYKYEDRNDYQALQFSRKLGEYNVKRYKYSYYPTANIAGSYQKQSSDEKYTFFGKDASWFPASYVSLNINVPIFSGFAKNANLAKSRLQLQQTTNQIDNLKISIDNDVAQSLNTFKTAITAVDLQKKNKALAESVYNQTKKKYESGLASNTDLMNAQTDMVSAQTNYISALYDAVIAKVDYTKAIGKL